MGWARPWDPFHQGVSPVSAGFAHVAFPLTLAARVGVHPPGGTLLSSSPDHQSHEAQTRQHHGVGFWLGYYRHVKA